MQAGAVQALLTRLPLLSRLPMLPCSLVCIYHTWRTVQQTEAVGQQEGQHAEHSSKPSTGESTRGG